MKKHRIFDLVVKKSNNLKRRISCFCHSKAVFIVVYAYVVTRKKSQLINAPWFCIKVFGGDSSLNNPNSKYFLEEYFCLFPKNGEIKLLTNCEIKSTTGKMIHSFNKEEDFTHEDISKSDWLSSQLNVLARWLGSKRLVRVDPYNRKKVLVGEETEEDKKTAEMLKKIDTWIHNFQNCEIKPGIITPGDDSLGRN